MADVEAISEKPITMAELKEELKKIRNRDNALNFRAEQTEDYLNNFVTLNEKEAKALYKKIDELAIPRLKPDHIIKLIDIFPTNQEEVRTILQGYALTVTKENMKKIADILLEAQPALKKEKTDKPEKEETTEEPQETEETTETAPAPKKEKAAKKAKAAKAEKTEEAEA